MTTLTATSAYTRQELMAAAASREFREGDVCFIGTGLPMVAAYLAKATHAPNAVLIFESGIIDARPRELATGVGDYRLLDGCAKTSGLFYALSLLQRGYVDLGFLGAAEVDVHGNINTTLIGGDYRRPRLRLPGSGGANDIASLAGRVAIIVPHDPRKLVERVQYVTTPGYLDGPAARERAGLRGSGPTHVITDMAVLGFDPDTKRLRVDSIHPGVDPDEVRTRSGFPLEVTPHTPTTPPPTGDQVRLLREVIDPEGIYIGRAG